MATLQQKTLASSSTSARAPRNKFYCSKTWSHYWLLTRATPRRRWLKVAKFLSLKPFSSRKMVKLTSSRRWTVTTALLSIRRQRWRTWWSGLNFRMWCGSARKIVRFTEIKKRWANVPYKPHIKNRVSFKNYLIFLESKKSDLLT